jgi:dihydropyrimidinase
LKAGSGLRAPGSGKGEARTLVAGGTVWTPEGPRRADVLVENGRIARLDDLAGCRGEAEVVDATGLHVVPGFIDVHVHIADRIGRCELADDFASGTEIAVMNGITTLFTFATQRPGETLGDTVARYVSRAAGRCHCDVGLHLTPTVRPWDWDAIEAQVAAGRRTVKLYTTYRDAGLCTDWDELEAAMRRLADLGGRLFLHCEDDGVLAAVDGGGADMSSPVTHSRLRPEAAEVVAIGRAIELSERTGCPLHVVHVSTAEGAALVAAARASATLTAETGPQYVLFSEDRLRGGDGHRFLCTPPLRCERTRERLEAMVVAGEIDLLATDHCAFRRADKDDWRGDHRRVPNGLAGLGALVPLAFEVLVARHGLSLAVLVERLAANPARVVGLFPRKGAIKVGADADLAVIDPAGAPRPVVSTLADAYDPWGDRRTTLHVRHVLLSGRPVVRDGALLDPGRPAGRLLGRR